MTIFEKACSELEKDETFETDCENVIEWINRNNTATVTFSQVKMINKIKALAKKYPEECQIVAENKASIVAHIPENWTRIRRNQHKKSEERRELLRQQMKEIREKKKK